MITINMIMRITYTDIWRRHSHSPYDSQSDTLDTTPSWGGFWRNKRPRWERFAASIDFRV